MESTESDIKDLGFGGLKKPKLIKKLSESPKMLTISPSDIPLGEYPANDSEEVKKELEYVVGKVRTKKEQGFDKEVLNKTDSKPLILFLDYLKSQNLKYDKKFLRTAYEDISRIVIKLKMQYDRPRPQQLGPLLGFDFEAAPTSTDATPSFPSGHTTQAWSVAHYLADKYPEHTSSFYDIARLIEEARVYRGAHYPSDNVFAKYISKHYLSHSIKEAAKEHEKLDT